MLNINRTEKKRQGSLISKIKSLFSKKNPVIETKPIVKTEQKFVPEKVSNRIVPNHNNRKRTRGRIIQEIRIGNHCRYIYHSAI
jgi:hypothetical protein